MSTNGPDPPTTAGARRWRFEFPADGSAVVELTGPFDDDAVTALRPMLAELSAHEPRGLVLDLSPVGEFDGDRWERLVTVVGLAPHCPLVIATPCTRQINSWLSPAGRRRDVMAVETTAAARRALRGAAVPRRLVIASLGQILVL